MRRLIEKGLMFGNLVEVASPALVARYNRALKHLTGRQTALADFHIDISGFSPEIGDEFGDDLYLNRDGQNRQFILLTTAQKHAPLLNARYSTSRGILRQFIDANETQLFALTARDAVAGELQNSVFALEALAQLHDLRRITVEADTIGGHVRDAARLSGLITRFQTERDGWRDDLLIAEMITLAKRTGDVTRVPIALPKMTFEQPNFWSSEFGGVYVFGAAKTPATILSAPAAALGAPPPGLLLSLAERNPLADWLMRNGLVETIVAARGVDAAALLRQKMDFILVAEADRLGLDLTGASRAALRKIAADLGAALPEAFLGLAEVLRWAEAGGRWPEISSAHPAYFYLLRAAQGPDRGLVNMLLAELSPLDIRQLFICHKALFYRLYAGWSETKRHWAADFLAREYQIDKAGARAALFGPEPEMDASPRSAVSGAGPRPHLAAGPWGKRGGSGQ